MKHIALLIGALLLFYTAGSIATPLYAAKIDLVKLKKEEEKRKKKAKKSKYVVTNKNLDKLKGSKKPYSVIKAGSDDKKKTGQKNRKNRKLAPATDSMGRLVNHDLKNEEYWQDKKRSQIQAINKVKTKIAQMQKKESELREWAPAASLLSDHLEALRVADKLKESIKKHKIHLGTLEKELEALLDKARKAGVPPGWLRLQEE
ncbi:MAG: hypothetical protein GY757_42275 [bacterium]|nr:hypothetical protein [bacterium]